MTPKQRIEAALLGESPDVVPFTVYENKLPVSEAERRLRNDGLAILVRTSAFRPVYSEVTQEQVHFTGTDGVSYVRTVVHTPAGTLTALDRPVGFTSWHEQRLFKGPDDYEPLEAMIADRQYVPTYDQVTRLQGLMGEDGFVRVGIGYSPLQEIIYSLMGLEQFSIQWAENRERVMRLYRALTEDRRKIYPLVAASPALAANYGGNVSPEVVGRDRFEKMILPHYDEAAEILHAHGKLLGVHFDANTRALAPGIARSKMDYVEAFTPAPTCDMTVAEAREAWPDKVLWINFPSSTHLGTIQEIEDMTRLILRQAAPGDRFLIGITEDVPEDRWQGNFAAILRVVNREGRLPIAR
ncbi:MAG: hypothetical protein HPY83_08590 [Anaerolineae bacterium]|nr:hypothetical protein [Anaerolineae bacterium]